MSTIQDTDTLLVNRGGTDYKVKAGDLDGYFNPKMPWEGAVGIYHVIITDPGAINVQGPGRIYNKDTQLEVGSINAPGEYIITSADIRFWESNGNWEFGPLTDTSKVTDMTKLFGQCEAFNSDLSIFDTSNVTSMVGMFFNAQAFNQDISGWDVSKVTGMNDMFFNAKAFNQDLTGWCVTNITSEPGNFKFLSGMPLDGSKDPCWGHCPRGENGTVDPCPSGPPPWEGAEGIYHVIITDPAVSIVPKGEYKIYNKDTGAEVGGLIQYPGEYIIAGVNIRFENSRGNWQFGPLTDTSKVTSMHLMFYAASGFNSDISNWDVSNVTNMYQMFRMADGFNQDISNWNVSKVTNMNQMFFSASKFSQDLTSWCVTKITSEPDMFKFLAGMPQDGSKDPKWGTCPRGEDQA